jgi:hypothetical protein
MYYGRGMILITYVDNTLFFGADLKAIKQVISELEGLGYGPLTHKEGDKSTAFAFLGVSITPDPITKLLKLTQKRLIKKVLESTGMSDCRTCGPPSLITPPSQNRCSRASSKGTIELSIHYWHAHVTFVKRSPRNSVCCPPMCSIHPLPTRKPRRRSEVHIC